MLPASFKTDKAARLTKFGYISFLLIFVVFLFTQLLILFFSHNLSLSQQGNAYGFTDFVHFYLSGKITLSPSRELFYCWDVQKQFLENLTHCAISGADFYTPYLPIVFIMMAPYSLLPIDLSHLLFDFVNLSVGLSGCWVLIKHFQWTKSNMAKYVLLGTLASMPAWNTLMLGQITWLYVGLICFYIVALRQNKYIKAGFNLALTIIKPQYAVFLLIPALSLRRYYVFIAAAIWEIFFFAVCALVFGLKALLVYPFVLNQAESSASSVHAQLMYCLRPFIEIFFSQQIAYHYCLILFGLGWLAVTSLGFYGLKKRNTENAFLWLTSLTVLASLLFSPHAHSHDALFLVLPALLTLPANLANKQTITSILWRWIFYLLPIISWLSFFLVFIHLPGNLLFTTCIIILTFCAYKQYCLEIVLIPSQDKVNL